ncbi:hypothetical protein MUK42_36644 [Musa troglodytarum]|uniref:Uncharacterized protein n=1 Tax=Musa troglodytarum TaxID=320322 RepID=A0A9E7FFI3_9LILI|nr:hypothetical protein MUK42_36644 [Musa troglodytarum]
MGSNPFISRIYHDRTVLIKDHQWVPFFGRLRYGNWILPIGERVGQDPEPYNITVSVAWLEIRSEE